jgi:hypothetical protein
MNMFFFPRRVRAASAAPLECGAHLVHLAHICTTAKTGAWSLSGAPSSPRASPQSTTAVPSAAFFFFGFGATFVGAGKPQRVIQPLGRRLCDVRPERFRAHQTKREGLERRRDVRADGKREYVLGSVFRTARFVRIAESFVVATYRLDVENVRRVAERFHRGAVLVRSRGDVQVADQEFGHLANAIVSVATRVTLRFHDRV